MQSAAALHRLLGDEGRLRMLRLLSKQRLNVTELTAILDLAQSGVSRHLRLLREAGLVLEEREGGYAFYRLSEDGGDAVSARLRALLTAEFEAHGRDRVVSADEARLQEVLRRRKEDFDAASVSGERRQIVPGRSWAAWARALGHLLPPLKAADLGCGEGYLTIEISRWARSVIAVDRSPAVLRAARALASRRNAANITWKKGDIERLPIRDTEVDVAILSQALHHAVEPERALAEAARILVPGGRLLVLDLGQHGEDWVRERLGHNWLGFTADHLASLLNGACLEEVRVQVGARKTADPFTVLIASGVKARDARRPGRRR